VHLLDKYNKTLEKGTVRMRVGWKGIEVG